MRPKVSGERASAVELDTLDINKVMIHRIPKVNKADKQKNGPELSDLPLTLTPQLKDFFRDRMRQSLAGSFAAVYDQPTEVPATGADPVSTVPKLVVDYFAANMENLVEVSQGMATELYERQLGSSSEGLLVVIDAVQGAGKSIGAVLGVLKLEDDEALLVAPRLDANGRRVYDAQILPITLPKAAKVFKAALFQRAKTVADLAARVSDNQRDQNVHGPEVARFFLNDFLGCRLRDTADRVTKAFVDRAEEFINTLDEDKQHRYMSLILAEVEKQATEIKLAEVAVNIFDKEDRDGFLKPWKAQDGSVPTLTKDLTLIGSRAGRVRLEFEDGVVLSGPREAVDEHLEKGDDGVWRIRGKMTRAKYGGLR